ncbi:MAG: DinB family protein [Dehalococcoidia bacterium]
MTTPSPLDGGYEPPPGLPPLLLGLLTTSHDRHVDMANLIARLPPEALDWRPVPRSASLTGLVLHITDVECFIARVTAGYGEPWTGENGSRMDDRATVLELQAAIIEAGLQLKTALEAIRPSGLARMQPGEQRSIGEMLVEELDHSAMHYGQMQLTRHLWEASHPGFEGTYRHWR